MKNKLGILASAVLVISAVFMMSFMGSESKIGYVDNARIYDEFSLTKKLDEQLKGTMEVKKSQLDSLELEITMMENRLRLTKKPNEEEIKLFELKKQEYFSRRQKLVDENSRLSEQYNQQIFQQINRLVKEFGKENHFRFILGGNGTGNVMYTEDAMDVTADVIKYINENYK